MIVLDANILIRAILGPPSSSTRRDVRSSWSPVLCTYVAFDDAEKYLPPLLKKRGKSDAELSASLEYLRHFIAPVDHELYSVFESEARQRLRGRDENDWPVLASALALECAVWTEDADFFGTGIAASTTNRIEIFLKAEAKPNGSEQES